VVLWFKLLGYNQHSCWDDAEQNTRDGNRLVIDAAQSECHSSLLVIGTQGTRNEPGKHEEFNVFSRAWRLYNLECSSRLGQDVYIACKSGVMACTKPFANGLSKFGTLDPNLTQALFKVDLEMQDVRDLDRSDILGFIQESNGGDGLDRLRRRLQRWAANHLVLCPSSCEKAKLEELCAVPGFSIHSEFARGNLGQSSLHEAVAANSLHAAKTLLAHGFPPDATDAMQETPLHYAALTGNAELAKWLLNARADLQMESRYGETALDVAKQNIAAFLGADSLSVAALLEDAASLPKC